METRKKHRQHRRLLVVEAGNDLLKMLLFSPARGHGGKIELLHVQRMSSPCGMAEAIADVCKQHKLNPDHVIGVLPRSAVSIRLLELPSVDPDEIADMVEIQAGRQTPYSRDEIIAGYRVLAHTRRGAYSRIMLAIVQRSTVRERFHELERGGLEVAQLAVAPEGLISWLMQVDETPSEVQAVVDIDAACSDLMIVQNGDILFSKQIMLGRDHFKSDESDKAEPVVDAIERALKAGIEALSSISIKRLLVTGADDVCERVAESLRTRLELPIDVVCQFLSTVEMSGSAGGDGATSGASVTALLGIATTPEAAAIDLTPEIVLMRRRLSILSHSLSRLAALLMALLVSGALWLTLATAYRADRLRELRGAIESTTEPARRVERMIEVVREVETRNDTRFSPLNLLSAIHESVPEGVLLTQSEIHIDQRNVRLAGTAPSRPDLRIMIANVENSPLFVDAQEAGRNVENADGRFVFEVQCKLKEIN